MCNLDDIEKRRLCEQEHLDALKSASERNRWGQFATPPVLALDIARYACTKLRNQAVSFLDPAIGTGSFFSALCQAFPAESITRAAGVELDMAFAEAASVLWQPLGLEVTPQDFTRLQAPSPENRFNLILTNPPYVRHHHLRHDEKLRLKRRVAHELGLEVSGLAGLYVYFLLLSHDWLADDALAVWLIPSEFMDVNYGNTVKRYLTTRVKLLQIHRFCPSDVQFSDALVSSAIVIYRKTKPSTNHTAILSFGGRLQKPIRKDKVSLDELRATHKWTKYPHSTDTITTVDSVPLGDLFIIKRGLATGANGFFILPLDEAREVGIPARFLKPILPSPRHLRCTVIERRPDGYPKVKQPLALIDCHLPKRELQQCFPDFWAYLEQGIKRGIHEGYLASRRIPWYSQEQRAPAPFVCTYMGRAVNDNKPFRFMWNKSDATAANVYLLLYPKGQLKEVLEHEPRLVSTVFEVMQTITTEMFLGESRVYGGGLYKLEPKELARVSAAPILQAVAGISPRKQMSLFT
ncbi:MAG: Eco57I restriction-modification methylase domain-containing protein [Phycisphaerae bacterium]|nr:Eco57I restriction-modification methylase domain-containing protein [Phycisphaerae bacterium]